MSEKHILCGFDVPEFEKRMKMLLKERGYEATTYTQLSKKGVKDFLEQNPKCDTVILLEASNFKKSYTAEEIAALTDKREINVIVVLSSRHIGTDYMKTLYVAGVTNAIFQMGRKDGASAKDIVERIINKRNRQEARKYYGIEHLDLEPSVMIDMDTYAEYYKRLHADEHLLVNYLKVCSDMSPKQIADFTKRMPAEDRAYLEQFEEFHMLMEAVKSMGVVIKVKRPKKTVVGMKVAPQIQVSTETIKYTNHEELFHLPKPENMDQTEVKPVPKDSALEDILSDEMFLGMSMEELLLAAEKNTVVVPKEKLDSQKQVDADSASALEEAKRLQEAAEEKQRVLDLEQKRFEDEKRAFEDERKDALKALQAEELRIKQEALEVEKRVQLSKAEEEKAKKQREKEAKAEVERRIKEEQERVRRKEQEQTAEEEAEIYTSGKQFSGGFLVGLLLLCGLAAGALFAIPYLKQSGFF